MERDEKTQLLLDMQEHPEQFSEQALTSMLDDPEVRELMEATAQLKQAMISEESTMKNEESAATDKEWQRFAQIHHIEEKHKRSWLKIAAAFIGILMVSGIAFAAIHLIRQTPKPSMKPRTPNNETMASNPHQPSADTTKIDTVPSREVVRYDEATLERILTDMSSYYGLTLNWKNEEAKSIRLFYTWKKQKTAAEAIETINVFERIHLELDDSVLTADIQTSSSKR